MVVVKTKVTGIPLLQGATDPTYNPSRCEK